MYRGVRFIESPNAFYSGTGAATLYRTIVAGAQALAWADPALLQTFVAGFIADRVRPARAARRCRLEGLGRRGAREPVRLVPARRHRVHLAPCPPSSRPSPRSRSRARRHPPRRAPSRSRWRTRTAVARRCRGRSTAQPFRESGRQMVRDAKDDDSDAREAASLSGPAVARPGRR